MTFVNKTLAALALAAASIAALAPIHASAQAIDLSPEQPGRPRSQKVDEAIKLVAKDFKFAKEGVLTVGTTTGRLPFGAYATDNKTPVGNAPDIAQLVADSLGRKLELVSVAWADWPLGLSSGKYDAVISNVGVTEQRKEKFDFSTYRLGLHGFYVRADSKITAIKDPKDIAGLKIITGSGTNQERILLEWNKKNLAAGLKPVELFALEEGLRCRDLACVIGEIAGNPRALDFTASRRLTLTAEKHGVPLWLVRLDAGRDLSSARMRWDVRSAPSPHHRWNDRAPGIPSWRADLFRSRMHPPGTWTLYNDGHELVAAPFSNDDWAGVASPHPLGLAFAAGDRSLAAG